VSATGAGVAVPQLVAPAIAGTAIAMANAA
jgi:hypothetical protein